MEVLLREARNGGLDTEYVRVFLDCLALFPFGSFVQLSNGVLAQVIRSNGAENTRPLVVPIDATGHLTEQEIDFCARPSISIVEAMSEFDAQAWANLYLCPSD